jgi:hypothetical protein
MTRNNSVPFSYRMKSRCTTPYGVSSFYTNLPLHYIFRTTIPEMPIFHRGSSASSSSGRSTEDPNQAHHSHKILGNHSSHSTGSSISSRTGSSIISSRRHSLLRRTPGDPSIQAAHDQVLRAEAAEREADKALKASRGAVKEAKERIRHLEREAAEG